MEKWCNYDLKHGFEQQKGFQEKIYRNLTIKINFYSNLMPKRIRKSPKMFPENAPLRRKIGGTGQKLSR